MESVEYYPPNDSGINDHQEWMESIESSYWCPYCGDIKDEPKMCCSENHMRLISEMNHEEKDQLK